MVRLERHDALHVLHLGGSHYSQYLGISAGIVAVLLTLQPVLTALFAARWMHERLTARQWLGVALGFAGVVLIVWHKIDVREITTASLTAVCVSLVGATVGTLAPPGGVAAQVHQVERADDRRQRIAQLVAQEPGQTFGRERVHTTTLARGRWPSS